MRVALGLGSLPLQRIHLAGDFIEDIVDARQVQLALLQPRLGKSFASFEPGHARRLFDNRAPVVRFAAQDLADAPLLDDGVGLRSQARAHEQILNVAQAADFSVQEIFAFARAEEPPGDYNFARLELRRLQLAAPDLQHHVLASFTRAFSSTLGRIFGVLSRSRSWSCWHAFY